MAIYEKLEFLTLCGLDVSIKSNKDKFSVWVGRNNIVLNQDGYVDDSNPQNRDWLIKQRTLAGVNEKKANELEIPKAPKQVLPDVPDDSEGSYNLEKRIKEQQLEKLKYEVKILSIKEEKQRGEIIPIELVRNIFTAHAQSIITSQKDGIDELIINVSKEANLSGEAVARLRGKMIEILNSASDRAVELSKLRIKLLVEEFSMKKEVGEHE